MPLTAATNLSTFRLAAGEPFVVQMIVDGGVEAGTRAFFMSVYGPGRTVQDTIEGFLADGVFQFVRNGSWSEVLYGRSGLKIEIAERLNGGRAIIASPSLTVDVSADASFAVSNGVVARSAVLITASLSEAGIATATAKLVPYVQGVSSTTPKPVFVTPTSISSDGTPQVGETLMGIDGVASNTTSYTRRWLLGSNVVSNVANYTPQAGGVYRYETTANGFGGTETSGSNITVAEADVQPSGTPVTGVAGYPAEPTRVVLQA